MHRRSTAESKVILIADQHRTKCVPVVDHIKNSLECRRSHIWKLYSCPLPQYLDFIPVL